MGKKRVTLVMGGTPYKSGRNRWEFSSFHRNTMYDMTFMANVFRDALQRFPEKSSPFCGKPGSARR